MVDTQLKVTNTTIDINNETTYHHDMFIILVPHNTTHNHNLTSILSTPWDDLLQHMIQTKTKYLTTMAESRPIHLHLVELPASKKNNSTEDLYDGEMGRKVAASVLSIITSKGRSIMTKTCGILLPSETNPEQTFWSECTSTILSGLYRDLRYKSKKTDEEENQAIHSIEFITSSTSDVVTAVEGIHHGTIVAKGIYLAKDIVNAPHNSLNSHSLASLARDIAAQSGGRLTCRILDATECARRGMGAFLAVARGSETTPQFIHLTYTPPPRWNAGNKKSKKNKSKILGIVGKGLLFDSGGYNIKTAMMEMMKFDCGGAAAILGAASILASLKPPNVQVHFVIAACENMINERAMVPGDIITASNGKTIEVINTDAEGRLTMADALVYVDQHLECDTILELSTLTGACVGALGTAMAGIWTDHGEMLESLKLASKITGDQIWHMPLEKSYQEDIVSKIADLKNLGGKYAGAITAALFLTQFVNANKPFAHIDMAGTVWNDKKSGATGWGTKLVTEWVSQISRQCCDDNDE
jgi:leucyl aminopeptidase